MSTHAEITKVIARLSVAGITWSQVAKRLRAERITTVRGAKFSEGTAIYYKDLAKARANALLRRERLLAARVIGTHTPSDWQAILARANGRCERCGVETRKLEKDHIKPLCHSGSDAPSNLRALCRRCNRSHGPGQSATVWKFDASQ